MAHLGKRLYRVHYWRGRHIIHKAGFRKLATAKKFAESKGNKAESVVSYRKWVR